MDKEELSKHTPSQAAEDAEKRETRKAESMMDRGQQEASDWQYLEARYRDDLQKMLKGNEVYPHQLRELADTIERDRKGISRAHREERDQSFDPRRSDEENVDRFLHTMLNDRVGGPGDAVKGLSEMLNLYIQPDAGQYNTEDFLTELQFRINVADKFLEKFDELPFTNLTGGRENIRRDIVEVIKQAKKFLKDKEDSIRPAA